MNDEPDALELVRKTLQDSTLFSPGVTAQIDALRASIQDLKARGIDPTSKECERTWMVAGGTMGQLLASKDTSLLLGSQGEDDKRGALAAHLFWFAGISPHPTKKLPG